MIGYTVNTSVYILTPVMERENLLKYILTVMGCRTLPYWLGTLLFDYCVFSITYFVFMITVYIQDVAFLIPFLPKITLVLAAFGASLLNFCYLNSFLFSKSNSAIKIFPVVCLFLYYTLPIILLFIFSNYTFLFNMI